MGAGVVVTGVLVAVAMSLVMKLIGDTVRGYYVTPRRIKRAMERQGVRGPHPRPLSGNLPEMSSMVADSTAHDMSSLSHDIVSRLLPHYVAWSHRYGKRLFTFTPYYKTLIFNVFVFRFCLGKRFIYWNGIEPRMCLTETELIKELLSKYSSISGKSWHQQQGSKHFIGRGLLMANGDDWYHQRHIVAPAFMGDKLKVSNFKYGLPLFIFFAQCGYILN